MIENRTCFRVVLSAVLFLVPLNIYMIGSGIGSGIQWALFRYQQTVYGTTFFTLDMDLGYVITGVISGRSAVSTGVWLAGVLLLVAVVILVLLAVIQKEDVRVRHAGCLAIIAALAFLAADMLQYGLIFSGPAGFAIPVGIPLVFVCGWWLIHEADGMEIDDTEETEPVLVEE
jgi:hypothetical protein